MTASRPHDDSGAVLSALNRFELLRGSEGYPARLQLDPQGPEVLRGRGDPCSLAPGIAIIGSRQATPYGIRASHLVAQWAVDAGMVVYSGAARGCDQAAHLAALDAGGVTVAVLGCGADGAYPRSASGLLDRIAATGAVIAPFEWGAAPMRYTFVVRNRIIAALSSIVVVTEARVPSGTFSTVEHANELNVEVAAVPGSIFSGYSDAPNRLIADGATSISCAADLRSALERQGISVGAHSASRSGPSQDSSAVVPKDRSVVQALRAIPLTIGQLAASTGIPASELAVQVERLCLEGVVTRYRDGSYAVLKR